MERNELLDLKSKVKSGNTAALIKYLKHLHSESQMKTNTVVDDHRFHQSRTVTLQEIINLLSEASE